MRACHVVFSSDVGICWIMLDDSTLKIGIKKEPGDLFLRLSQITVLYLLYTLQQAIPALAVIFLREMDHINTSVVNLRWIIFNHNSLPIFLMPNQVFEQGRLHTL